MEQIKIENLRFTYENRTAPALDEINLSVKSGEFVTVCGESGCGKSTLLRHLKPILAPVGKLFGTVNYNGLPVAEYSETELCREIGFVMQSPDDQLVCDKVWHELAFGLESLGLPTDEIRARVGEVAEYFGIADKFDAKVTELSGGQKQLVNLAAVMVMRPSLLILDEPTAQLDPIAASEHLAAIGRLNRELGMTVIIAEHRLEDAVPMSDRVIVMDRGKIIADCAPDKLGEALPPEKCGFLPCAARVWRSVPEASGKLPISVREGRAWLDEFAADHKPLAANTAECLLGETVLEARSLHFRYGGDTREAVKGLSLKLKRGEILALLGGNGSGKSTALSLLAGIKKPADGEVVCDARTSLLPQEPCMLFSHETVRDELSSISADFNKTARLCRIDHLYGAHPFDLSGGERQRLALAMVLLTDADILLCDEPTKGMDSDFKLIFAHILQKLKADGKAVILVSHDAEFCAEVADRCALFFDGAAVSEASTREFFASASYYTTAAVRMSRGIVDALTADELITRLGGKPHKKAAEFPEHKFTAVPEARPKRLSIWRRIIAVMAVISLIIFAVIAVRTTDLSVSIGGITDISKLPTGLYAGVLAAALILAASLYRKQGNTPLVSERLRLTAGSVILTAVMLSLIALTVYFGGNYFGSRRYYFTALLVVVEVLAVFLLSLEKGKPRARELALMATLCAIGVAGRAIIFMLPECKPVIAVVAISGAVLGSRKGFAVGALTMLVSNMLFGQGPWTPWQMLAMGAVGFIAGLVFHFIRPSRLSMCIYGATASVVIYGGIMNPASLLMSADSPNFEMFLAYYVTGLPIDLIRAASTAIFLWFITEPMVQKLTRVKGR